ncbi:MAG: AAA family ATPase [Actinomycetaceae bacterium]|nr:AAA family ATPase [Actinomycetaceae bacterium]
MTKYRSAVASTLLKQATFNSVTVEFAPVNFFFGHNGTGKSALSKAIRGESGLTWQAGHNPDDYSFHLFDREFIDKNFRQSQALPGVFTLDEKNIGIEEQIAARQAELADQRKNRNQAQSDKQEKETALAKAKDDASKKCWDDTSSLRKDCSKTQDGFKRSVVNFFDELLKTKSNNHDQAELKTLYAVAYDDSAHAYAMISRIGGSLPTSDLLTKEITSSTETAYAQFVKALKATDWVSQGHTRFANEAKNQCPYCAQALPEDFEEQIASCLDEAYQQDIEQLKVFADQYRNLARNIWSTPKRQDLTDLLPSLDLTTYDLKVDLLRARIESNIHELDKKLQNPSTKITLQAIDDLVNEINNLVDGFNKATADHNEIVTNQTAQQATCKKKVWELLAHTVNEELETFNKTKAELETAISNADKAERDAADDIARIESKIRELTSQTVNTTATMEAINQLLTDSGFEGFSLRPKPQHPNSYEVVRENGRLAEHLSEGERNFIAFLYFYFRIQGSLTGDGDQTDKIVIIDDPVSSMDSGALFIVASLVRELVNYCLNNWQQTPGSDNRDHVKQVFVLTHNAYFFKEASYNRISDYKHVFYFLVKKRNNQSSIDLCVRNRADAPSQPENYSPVSNAYAALWREYKELNSPTTLLNVMRRILEHYFLQLCGYDGQDLRTRILDENRDKFVTVNEDGTEDLTNLCQAESILAYITHNMTDLGDDIFYIENSADIDTCRETFRNIFTCMGQEQHYQMMGSTHEAF